jgi:hypothetical protein
MKKIGYIVETDQGDSIAYNVFADEKLSEKERWALCIIRGYELVPADSKVIRFEKEFEEVLS